MTVEHAPTRDPFALSEEERSVRDMVRDWAQREVAPGAAQRDEEERYDRSLFERAGELGLTGLPYPEELGGAGMGTFACALASRRSRPPTWAWRSASRPLSSASSASSRTGPMSRSGDSCRR